MSLWIMLGRSLRAVCDLLARMCVELSVFRGIGTIMGIHNLAIVFPQVSMTSAVTGSEGSTYANTASTVYRSSSSLISGFRPDRSTSLRSPSLLQSSSNLPTKAKPRAQIPMAPLTAVSLGRYDSEVFAHW